MNSYTFRKVAVLLFIAACSLSAQSITATLAGTVSDPNGAVIQGASIKASSDETGLIKITKTDSDGHYTIPFLAPGTYVVLVEAPGFSAVTRTGVRLDVAQTGTLDFPLKLSASQQSIEVTADVAPMLITDNAGVEHTLENKLIEDLPSAERSTMSMLNNIPGVIDMGFALAQGENLNTNGNAQGPIGSPGNRNFFDSNFGVSGGQTSTNDILLDGVSDTVADFNGVVISPPQDSVQEFKVLGGIYSAEYGRSGGGIVNFVTKGGGRKYHGTLYEYFQNGGLNANGWQRNRAGFAPDGVTPKLPRIPIKRSQFGGTFGGPVVLPKLGKSANTFFFFNYEGRREDNPFSKTLTMPTAKMHAGDLSELLQPGITRNVTNNADGSPALYGQLYSPYGALVPNGRQNANGSSIMVREAIPGNRLDLLPKCGSGARIAPCLDPIALNFMKYVPMPNQPGLVDNYLYSGTAKFRRDIYAARLDKTINERHSLFGRYTVEKRFQGEPDYLQSVGSNARIVNDTFANFTFNDVYMLTPRAINNFRYGYSRAHAAQTPLAKQQNFDPTTLGFPSYIRAYATTAGFPIFNFAGGPEAQGLPGEITGSQFGGGGNDQPRDTTTLANAVTILKGTHTLKTGIEYRLLRFFANQNTNPVGSYTYNRTFTRGPIPTVAPTLATETGSSLGSLFLGLPASASFQTVAPITLYHHYAAAFIQDDWKVTRNLTLNLGLRWDLETGTAETHGQVTSFDINAPSHLNGKVGDPTDANVLALRPDFRDLRGLLSFSDGPQSNTMFGRFAPRLGFAYRLNDKTTIRGGWGVNFVPQSLEQTSALGTNFTTNGVQSSDSSGQVIQPGGAATPTLFSTDPFRSNLIPPPGRSQGPDTLIGQSPALVESVRRTSYVQQYNFVIQRLLPKRFVLDVAYVGSHGLRLPFANINLNQIPTEFLDYARANFSTAVDVNGARATSTSAFFSQQVTNPFYGLITNPNSVLSSRTVRRDQLLKRYPQYDSPQLFRPLIGASKYNGLQISARKTYSNGLSMLAGFTFSKTMDIGGSGNNSGGGTSVEDIYNVASDYTLSNIDVPRRLTTSFSYELPFGKGKRFASHMSGFMNKVLGNFQTSGSMSYQSGTPVGVTAPGIGLAYAVRRSDRAYNVDARIDGDQMRANIRDGGFAFNPDAYLQPGDFQLGNAARNIDDTRRDSYKSFNISVLKSMTFREDRHKIQLRGEFLNALNMVVFGTPGRDVSAKDLVQNGVVIRQGTFARVTTQGNQPRIIQLVLRYSF